MPSEEETNRILEDLVIEAIAFDLIEAKIDQKNQTVKVQWVMSRDLTDLGLEELYQKSCSWQVMRMGERERERNDVFLNTLIGGMILWLLWMA